MTTTITTTWRRARAARSVRTTLLAAAAVLVLGAASGCSDDDHDDGAAAPQGDVVDVATEAGQFTTLLAAVEAAGLTATLRSAGPFTVFAPTDDAFAALPAGTVESLLLPENRDQLTAILTFHVVAGRVLAADAVAAGSATTVNGGTVEFRSTGSTVTVENATVVAADVPASNGVIHVIDAVMLP